MLDEAAGFESHVKHLIAKINAVTAAHEVRACRLSMYPRISSECPG